MAKREIIIDTRLEGIGRTQQDLDNINEKVKSATQSGAKMGTSLGASLNTINKSTQLVRASFNALNAVLILSNSTSDEMRELLIKLQVAQVLVNSAMQIYNSLQKSGNALKASGAVVTKALAAAQSLAAKATGGATVATRALSAAMLAIPILAIIAGITALVTWIIKLTKSSEDLASANDALIDSYDRLRNAQERSTNSAIKAQQRNIEYLKATKASAEEIYQEEKKLIDIREKARKADLDATIKHQADLQKERKKAIEQGNEEEEKRLTNEIQKASERQADLLEQQRDLEHERRILDARETNRQDEEAKRRSEQAIQRANEAKAKRDELRQKELQAQQKYEDTLLSLQQRSRDIFLQNIEDANLREELILEEKYTREREKLIKEFGNNTELLAQLEENRQAELSALQEKQAQKRLEEESEIERRNAQALAELRLNEALSEFEQLKEIREEDLAERIEAEKEYLNAMRELELEDENLTENEKLLIRQEYAQREKELEKELSQFRIDLAEKEEEEKLKFRSAAINSILNLSDIAFNIARTRAEEGSKEEEKIAKKQFKINKAMQIGMATITGIQTVMEAFKSGMAMPIIGPATGAAYAAIAGVASLANITKIASTKFGDGGGGADIGSVSMPSAPNISAPEIQRPDEFEVPEIDSEKDKTVRVVLLDSDLKENNNKSEKVDLISRG